LILVPAFAFWVAAGLNRRLERSRAAAATAGAVTMSLDRGPENAGSGFGGRGGGHVEGP
jgi:hypothetical protein